MVSVDVQGSLICSNNYLYPMMRPNAAYNNPKVVGLVYVAAFAPDQGQSISNFVDVKKLPKDFFIFDSGGFSYINPVLFRQSFAQDVDPRT